MNQADTAGTASARTFTITEPHRFAAEPHNDWGHRPSCMVCAEERGHELHRRQR